MYIPFHLSLVSSKLKAMPHQPTQLNSLVRLGPVGVCVVVYNPIMLLHSSLIIPDSLVGLNPSNDSTLSWIGRKKHGNLRKNRKNIGIHQPPILGIRKELAFGKFWTTPRVRCMNSTVL